MFQFKKERSFTFFPVGIIRKHKLSCGVFLRWKVNIEFVAAWRHFHSNHNRKFSVAFIPDAVHTAVVRGFALTLLTSYIDIALIFDQFFIGNRTIKRFIGKFLRKNF